MFVAGADSDAALHADLLETPTREDHERMVAPHIERLVSLGWPRDRAAAIYPYDPTAPLPRSER